MDCTMDIRKGKRRTRAEVVADLAVNHVERLILQCGWAVQRLPAEDEVDLLVTTFNRRGEIENGAIRLRIEASDSPRITRDRQRIAVRAPWNDLLYWLNEPLPVILMVYDAQLDRAWWLQLNGKLRIEGRRGKPGGRVTLGVPLTNVLDLNAIRHFRELRDRAIASIRGASHAWE